MKKFIMVVLVLILIPGIFAEELVSNTVHKFMEPTNEIIKERSYDPNARINLKPTNRPQHVYDSKGLGDILMTIDLSSIGMPSAGYDNAGLSWDGTYLYIVNMYDNNIYKIDPTVPSIVGNWPVPPDLCWGLGHEQNLWVTEVLSGSHNAYEYDYVGTPTGNSFYCLQGGAAWMADASEWWADGEIWILAVSGTNKAYKFSVPSGVCLDSIGDPAWTYTSQRGFTYDPFNNTFWVGGWNSDSIWEINSTTGTVLRSFPFNDVASLAYDWQSSLHPNPVLWVATNEASDYIYMVDADNPQPVTTILWDFETGLQGWTHTNGLPFPGGWDVESSYTHTPPPSPGDSTLWIDPDEYGSGIGPDTAWSPVFIPDPTLTQWVKYGVEFNGGSSPWTDDLYVGIRTYTGGTWNSPVELKHYVQGSPFNGWDSVDVSTYNTADRMQIYFCYTDNYTWGYWSGVDNISVNGILYVTSHDVGVVSIDEPGSSIPANTQFTPTATYRNFGSNTETFDAHYQIDSAGITVYSQAVSFTLNAGDDTTHAFTDYISGGIGVTYNIYAYTVLAGDQDPANDMVTQTTIINPWWIETQMPQQLMDHAVVFDGSDIYVLGGYTGFNSLDSVFIYSPSKGTWSVGPNMPVDLCMYDACVLGDTIYVPGGYSYGVGSIQDILCKYSISGNNWTTSSGTGEPAWFYACAAANGKVYRIGGYDTGTSTQWASTWAYTPGAGWTKMSDMPTATELSARWVRNNNIYIAGGVNGATSVMYNETQVYDAVGDTWTQDSTIFSYLPYTRWGAGSAFYRDTVYIMSGIDVSWALTDTVFYYAYGTNTWNLYPSVIQSVYRSDGIGVQGVGSGFDGIYLFGGSVGGFSPITDVQVTKILPSGIDEYIEEVRDYLSIPMSIGKGAISFIFNGEVSKNVIVVDITGRVVKRYDNVRPGTTLNFGDNDISSGIYFLSIEGERNSTQKVTLIR